MLQQSSADEHYMHPANENQAILPADIVEQIFRWHAVKQNVCELQSARDHSLHYSKQ